MPDTPDHRASSAPRRKKRRWLRIGVICLLVLVALGFAIDGPVARWFVERTLAKQLAKLQLEGEVDVSGHLHQGFTLTDGVFTGNGRIEALEFQELNVGYTLGGLRQKQIESLTGQGFSLVMQVEERAEPRERKPIPFRKIGESLRAVRPIVIPPRIDLRDVRLVIKRPGEAPTISTLDALTHEAGSTEFDVKGLSSTALETRRNADPETPPSSPDGAAPPAPPQPSAPAAPSGAPDPPDSSQPSDRAETSETAGQPDSPTPDREAPPADSPADDSQANRPTKRDFTIDWQEDSVAIDELETLPGIKAGDVQLTFREGEGVMFRGSVEAGGAILAIEADESGRGQLELTQTPLDLGQLDLPKDLALDGTIESFVADLTGLLDGPAAWRGEFNLSARNLSWNDQSLPVLDAEGAFTETGIDVDADLGPDLDLHAAIPRSGLIAPDGGFAGWEGLPVSVRVSAPSLHQALQTLFAAAGTKPLDLADLPDGALTITGNLTTGGPRGVSEATAQWSFTDIVYRDNPVPPLAGTATLAGDALTVNLALQNPGPDEQLDVAARLDLATMDYGANADIDLPDTAWLRPLLPIDGEEWKPEGALALTWTGNGNLREATHQGEASISAASFTAPNESIVEARLDANYDWPGSLTLSELWVRNGLLVFEGAAALADNRVTITNLRIHDETGDLATLDASLPLPPKGATLQDLLASEESITLDLDSNQLRLARLSDLFPLKLPEGLAFALDADLTLTGTPSQPVLDGTLRATEIRLPKGDALPPLSATMEFHTVENRLHTATTVTNPERDLLTFRAALPLEIETVIEDPEEIFTLPLEASLAIDRLPLDLLRSFAPALESLSGTLSASIEVANTFDAPILSGSLTASEVSGLGPEELPPLGAALDLRTENEIISATGTVTEPGGDLLSLEATLPLPVAELRKDPDRFSTLPLDASMRVENFDLQRLAPFAPPLEQAVGRLNVDLIVAGPISDPSLSGTATIDLESYPLPGTPYRGVSASRLSLRLDGQDAVIEPSMLTIAGGTIGLAGRILDLTGDEPGFDVRLEARQALLWRNDIAIARGNGVFQLTGPLSAAQLSGELYVIESLVYKDIDVLPMRVPITAAPEPQLPTIDTGEDPGFLPVPAPISDWTLDLHVRTQDPILLRGNRAKGEVNADIQVAGTVARPRPTGWIQLHAVEAGLPFSTLTIPRGTIILRPDHPFDPRLDIAGESQVGSYQISLYLAGPLSDPNFTLNSFPPLPKNEIMALLATGSTTASLQDPELAQMKALQLLVDDLRRRIERSGGSPTLERVVSVLDHVELRFGDNDPFRGQRRNSATLELSRRWYLSASFDQEGNTRGTIIYSIRFR